MTIAQPDTDIPDRLFIDSTCIKVHRTAGNAKGALANGIGQTRRGRNSKLHAACDVKGRPCVLLIPPGNVNDMKVTKQCIAAMPPSAELVGDKGYDSNDLRQWLAERKFCHFKDWRRVATRFDRNGKTFKATIAIAATVIWWLK